MPSLYYCHDTMLTRFTDYMEEHFPNYQKNAYLSRLPGLHKLLVKLIQKKQYSVIRLLFRLKDGK